MILITGATGYIGRQLVARLVAEGEKPRCLVRDMKRAAELLPADRVELVQGDITNATSLTAAVQGVDTIIAAAFMTADRKPSPGNNYQETNVIGTHNLVEAAQTANVQRIIVVSGLGTKPDRPGSYMQGRYLAEKMVIESGLQWTVLRPSVLFGKNAPFIKGLADLIKSAPVLPLIAGGHIKFQPISVEDVVTILTKILADPAGTANKIYTVGGPAQYSFRQVLDLLLQAMKKKRLKVYTPLLLVGIGATVMEGILPKPPLTRAALTLFTFDNITDLDSVERDFDFVPQSFESYLHEHGIT